MGLHFFMPAQHDPAGSRSCARSTPDVPMAEKVGADHAFARQSGRCRVKKDVIGFFRQPHPGARLMREALWLIEQGCGLGRGHRCHGPAFVRLPATPAAGPDHGRRSTRVGTRPARWPRSSGPILTNADGPPPAAPAQRRRGPHRLQDQGRLLPMERRVDSKRGARPIWSALFGKVSRNLPRGKGSSRSL